MGARATSRVRLVVTCAVTALVLFGEYAFIMAMVHLDDGVQAQQTVQARLDGALRTWQPGDPTGPVLAAARDLTGSGDGVRRVRAAAGTWAATPTTQGLGRLRAADTALVDDLASQERSLRLRGSGIVVAVLLLISAGWFVWFRRLVSRHRELQAALTEQQVLDAGERRLLALVQNSADLVMVLDPDTTASFVSPSARSVLGAAPEQLTGRRFVDRLVPDDVPVFARLLSHSSDTDETVAVRAHHEDGRELVLEGTVTNLLADESVAGLVLTLRDVTDRQALERELTHQAFHDPLTGLANRQLFGDRLAHALRRRGGTSDTLFVLFIDLDDFKDVNDSLGHGVGDQLLVGVAQRLDAAVREGDTAARLGGDEFAVLMESADEATARQVAERLLASLREPFDAGGASHSVRASIGMAPAVPGRTTSEETLRNADVAMYWAKDRGKGTIALYEAGLHAAALDRMTFISDLQRAIREDELVLHYQPTVDLVSGTISGFEALVRWQHPERGLLSPYHFITVAEQSGLIVPLGRWVLREACRAGAAMEGLPHRPSVAVNISAQQLALPDFVEEVVAVLSSTGMPAGRLVLEITESVILDDLEDVVAALSSLRDLGVRIAIDDFGTGYSSLSYLSQLPLDVLKIDKSFVDRICDRTLDTSLVEAIIMMSQGMGLTTVAEGVEQVEQAEWLRANRCSLGQGYLWSRPVELTAARELLSLSPEQLAPGVPTLRIA